MMLSVGNEMVHPEHRGGLRPMIAVVCEGGSSRVGYFLSGERESGRTRRVEDTIAEVEAAQRFMYGWLRRQRSSILFQALTFLNLQWEEVV